jgi:hypothetical protein
MSSVSVWKPGEVPLSKPKWKGIGRPTKLLRRDSQHQPIAIKDLAHSLPASAWKIVTWRQGTKQTLRSRFAAVRIRPAHRDYWRSEPYPEEWLLMEWPRGEAEPTKYWLSTVPADAKLSDLVRLAKQRWSIERDYQELKQELGLGHFEGRGWRGFHHHATLCIAAYGFLVAERSRFSPPHAPANYSYAPHSFRLTSNLAVRRARAERHNPTSIATLRVKIAAFSWAYFLTALFVARVAYNTVVLGATGPALRVSRRLGRLERGVPRYFPVQKGGVDNKRVTRRYT